MSLKKLFFVVIGLAFAIPAFAAEVLELRVIVETSETKALRESKRWTNPPATAWYASHAARKNTPGFGYAGPGYRATIEVMGTKSGLSFAGKSFPVLTKNDRGTDRTLVAEDIEGGIRFKDVDMGPEGAITVEMGKIFDDNKPFVIRITPNGWKGAGYTWNSAGGYFEADYSYRKDNETVLPEMYALRQ
jgi:hypothetical protein